jgi:Zn-dependent protease
LGTASVALVVYRATGLTLWAAIAHFGAVVNLFNLIPIWSLDGSRGLHSLTRAHRGIVLASAFALWMLTSNPMLFLIAAVCGYRMFTRDWQIEPDNEGLAYYVGLLAALALIGSLAPIS